MTAVTVRTQAELDKALADKADKIYIESPDGVWLRVANSGSSHVVAAGSSHVVAAGSSHVEAWDSSHVVARDSSHVEARDSSHVMAWDSSHVEAWDSSHVEAWGSSHVVAAGSSHVEAWGSSHVEAWGSSHVVAATKYVGVHLHSARVQLDGNGTIIDCTDIDLADPVQWCEFHGVEMVDGIAYVFKAVNQEWTTDRGIDYRPGSTPEAPDWDPLWRECGKGLHFCDHPIRSLGFLDGPPGEARFLKVGVRLDEMVPLDDKVRARRVVVPCVEVDRYGKPVVAAVAS